MVTGCDSQSVERATPDPGAAALPGPTSPASGPAGATRAPVIVSPQAPGNGTANARGADTPDGRDDDQAAGGTATTVTRIVDGDTLYVEALQERVRLIGIDTPETRDPNRGLECFGREATAHLAALVPPGTAVTLTFDVERIDRYGRPLAYLWRASDGLFVNLRMVADGYALAATFPPNVRHSERFVAAQREARDAGRGLWSACR